VYRSLFVSLAFATVSAGAVVRFNRSLSKLATLGLDSARRSKLDLVISGKGLNE
jgi:hypothetical protein